MVENTARWKPSGWPACSSASRAYAGPAGPASTTPPATRPASAIDFGPSQPARIGGGSAGGWSSATSSRCTSRPWKVTRSPASSRVTAVMTSSSVVSGDGVRAPICPIHDCTPWPMPGSTRPGREPAQRRDLHRGDRRVAGHGRQDAEADLQPLGHRQRRGRQRRGGRVEAVLDDPELVGAALVQLAGDLEDERRREGAVEAHPDGSACGHARTLSAGADRAAAGGQGAGAVPAQRRRDQPAERRDRRRVGEAVRPDPAPRYAGQRAPARPPPRRSPAGRPATRAAPRAAARRRPRRAPRPPRRHRRGSRTPTTATSRSPRAARPSRRTSGRSPAAVPSTTEPRPPLRLTARSSATSSSIASRTARARRCVGRHRRRPRAAGRWPRPATRAPSARPPAAAAS